MTLLEIARIILNISGYMMALCFSIAAINAWWAEKHSKAASSVLLAMWLLVLVKM